jgi:hypothetical protein
VTVPYVHSGYERRADDHYPTIGGRCVEALLATWPIEGSIVDCCAPQGSAIVNQLLDAGHDAHCIADAFAAFKADWIVTNPPYQRGLADRIAQSAVVRVGSGAVHGAAFLMRANWDLAQVRAEIFASDLYRGQTRMRFRPWWSDDRYVWHVWSLGAGDEPVVRYWP